jgi:Mg-chelatase subunit ChlD
MRDPVIAPDGYSYERAAITQWLAANPVSPITRAPMTASDLVPNRALRTTIEAYLAANPDSELPRPPAPAAAFRPAPTTVVGAKFRAPDGKHYLHVRVAAPMSGERQPVVLLPIIDNSGSMGATVGAAGGVEDMGFTRLDLVKHAVRTMAAILGPNDLMGVASFSSEAKIVLSPLRMDTAGKARVTEALETIRPDSATNIFDGLKKAAQLLADPVYAGHNIVAMLLTDGYPTVNPPRGIVPSLAAVRRPERWTLHAFGFGYDLDSALCSEIAAWGGGLFGFIPDATMVGTVFINALAHMLSTANLDTSFTVQRSPSAPAETVAAGPVTYGQPRDFLFEVQDEPHLNGAPVATGDPGYVLVHHLYRDAIRRTINACKFGAGAMAMNAAAAILNEFETTFRGLDDPIVQALLKDIKATKEGEGQIGMAPAHFGRWGEHYMRAYLRAQELQQCMNFKDPGLQIYGGELFHALQDMGDSAFCDLAPPTPSAARSYGGYGGAAAAAMPVNMSVFHNASGGCFAPETLIRRPDGSHTMITELKRGDIVWTPTGSAVVQALVVCGSYNRAQPMTKLGSLVITPWHPVRLPAYGISALSPEGDSAHPVRRHATPSTAWQFPADIAGYSDRLISTVYNLVLDSGHIVLADGWEALTLGHGFTEPVAAHDYFGTQRVVEDLMKQPGWEEGRPTFKNLKAVKDVGTDRIIGWIDDVNPA